MHCSVAGVENGIMDAATLFKPNCASESTHILDFSSALPDLRSSFLIVYRGTSRIRNRRRREDHHRALGIGLL
jgi:hypothetical protein